jgi:DNA-binding response OmpR family regulator
VEHARQAQSHRQLPDTVQGGDHPNDNESLWVHIMQPRKKIEVDHDHPSRIRSVPGHGYVINWIPEARTDRCGTAQK